MTMGELDIRVARIVPMQMSNEDRRLASLTPLLFVGELAGVLGLLSIELSDALCDALELVGEGVGIKTESVGASATPATPVWLALGVPFSGASMIAGKLLIDDLTAAISKSAAF